MGGAAQRSVRSPRTKRTPRRPGEEDTGPEDACALTAADVDDDDQRPVSFSPPFAAEKAERVRLRAQGSATGPDACLASLAGLLAAMRLLFLYLCICALASRHSNSQRVCEVSREYSVDLLKPIFDCETSK
eukprot:SAG31_NODE_1574_length_7845_cov_6.400207_2_plen_131_part_00